MGPGEYWKCWFLLLLFGRMPENTAFAVIIGLNLNAHLFLFQIGLGVHGHSLGLWAESIFCQHGENVSEFFVI